MDQGKLSQLQLEGVMYACTKHQEFLPNGESECFLKTCRLLLTCTPAYLLQPIQAARASCCVFLNVSPFILMYHECTCQHPCPGMTRRLSCKTPCWQSHV